MITREEAKQKLCMNLLCSEASGISWFTDDFVLGLIDQLFDQQGQLEQHIKSLEAQLSNTEQLTCDGCTHEKQSSPLFIHCLGCNRAKHLKDKFHDINEPCRG